ncbi:predicted protein [Pyrenophora tritici-repentis Pt-1C-BFP]|uniref:Uncharacterized protein n=1 Tax=Pyrenophora tritici-repentis (strain Pt-1C-BFP) TaxID=426418 RepID=B2VRA6_PYRTR|nr:uncharacterized protein PTRG_00009 [Pyrenophora tritici-repentis Pt-1C-BFP]EDU39447.1 predicted protein [Pyrenophora tritici-repentis Pt-1C-BFP]
MPVPIHRSLVHSRAHFGGYNNPSLNAILKFWLGDENRSIGVSRKAQAHLIAKTKDPGINPDASFVAFSRAVPIYDYHFHGNMSRPTKV